MAKHISCVILMLVLLLGCSDSMLGEKNRAQRQIEGEWTSIVDSQGTSAGYIFRDGKFIGLANGNEVSKGSYTVSNGEITTTTEHFMFPISKEERDTLTWFTREEFVRQYDGIEEKLPLSYLDALYSTVTYAFKVDGDALELSYPTELDEVYFDTTYEDYQKTEDQFKNMTVTQEWVTMSYSRVRTK